MSKRNTDLVIHFPDADEADLLVTYVSVTKMGEAVGVSCNTVYKWIEANAIRAREFQGQKFAALADALRLRFTAPKDTLADGIYRQPPRERRRSRDEYVSNQYETLKSADHRYEPWDDYDLEYLIASCAEGLNLLEVAKELGRTYSAVVGRLEQLRKAGEVPAIERDRSWIPEALGMLTHNERARLLSTAR